MLNMALKRRLEFDVSEAKECGSAVVHSVVVEVSPVKKSKKDEKVKYFRGQISNGKESVRVISFQPKLRDAMCKSVEKKNSVCLVNCQMRGARGGDCVG